MADKKENLVERHFDLSMYEPGTEPGDVCNRDGCIGVISEHEHGTCYCRHTSPPCGACCHDYTYCPVCDYEPEQP